MAQHDDDAVPMLLTPALLQQQVYHILQKRITSCETGYEPGTQLNLTRIANELHISITPVKDAIKRLQSDGLVVTRPRQGIFVQTLSSRDLRELLAVRRGLEMMAVDFFAPPLDPELAQQMQQELNAWEIARKQGDVQEAYAHHITFHALVTAACGNRILQRIYEQLYAHWSIAFSYYIKSFNQTDDEILRHRLLLAALEQGDAAELRARVVEHYRQGRPIIGPDGPIPLEAGAGPSTSQPSMIHDFTISPAEKADE